MQLTERRTLVMLSGFRDYAPAGYLQQIQLGYASLLVPVLTRILAPILGLSIFRCLFALGFGLMLTSGSEVDMLVSALDFGCNVGQQVWVLSPSNLRHCFHAGVTTP